MLQLKLAILLSTLFCVYLHGQSPSEASPSIGETALPQSSGPTPDKLQKNERGEIIVRPSVSCSISWTNGTTFSVSGADGLPNVVKWCVAAWDEYSNPVNCDIWMGGTDNGQPISWIDTGEQTPHCFEYTLQSGDENNSPYTRFAFLDCDFAFCNTGSTTLIVKP